MVYSRELWIAVEGYNSVRTICPDHHFVMKLLSQKPVVVYVHRQLFRYRDYLSNNRAATQTTIRSQIDEYLNTLEFSDDAYLQPTGLSRDDLIRAMLDRICLKEALSQLGLGHYGHAFKIFAFCMATYPRQTLRMAKAYPLVALLATGPVALLIAPPVRGLYRKFASRSQPYGSDQHEVAQ